MALLNIINYPDNRLRNIANPVPVVDQRVRGIIYDMLETMYNSEGIGLAATQVNIQERIIVIDIYGSGGSDFIALINPEIIWRSSEMYIDNEGCLSIPGIYDRVERCSEIVYVAMDKDGNIAEHRANGLLARCIQHEIDHLNGKLFIEYLSSLKQNRIRSKYRKSKTKIAFSTASSGV
ncbi:peptide deformylase [Candidatus Kinetoplastibacterium blastocrithidii TCC012E]|uniref:Peptide deformylase n=1 Tax=Candidatus Kinetoplastidibacterium blastocrithidiae TCC012E TaxID=1208922 RepID=M1LC92_9PROT|nr:peptide deformylase [Candidatus Kinetoplastibacterium blastocrithidii]AFZ83249.1 peptide deformylase [Candidatus Kinetoplastibacterium blastocrithidii (ex Strigomonas culicis)]AGF50063.1 peptide deformylase [Candidatus Kinetoplastibacterium blastocrithidii TCC012E]